MSSNTAQKDITTIPTKLLNDFSDNFEKLQKIYELIDHVIADRQVKENKIKNFKDINELFDDLDN